MSSSKRKSLPTKISQTRNSDDSIVSLNHSHHHNSVITNDTSSSKSPSYDLDSEPDEDEETEYQSGTEEEDLATSPTSMVNSTVNSSDAIVKGTSKSNKVKSSSLKEQLTHDDQPGVEEDDEDDDEEGIERDEDDDEEDDEDVNNKISKLTAKSTASLSSGLSSNSLRSPCKKVRMHFALIVFVCKFEFNLI